MNGDKSSADEISFTSPLFTYSIIPPLTLPPTVLASSPDNSHKSSRIVSSQMNAWSGAIDVLRISRFSSSRMLLKID